MSEYIQKLQNGAAVQTQTTPQTTTQPITQSTAPSTTPSIDTSNDFDYGTKKIDKNNILKAIVQNINPFLDSQVGKLSDKQREEVSDQINLIYKNIENGNISSYNGKFNINDINKSGLNLSTGGSGEIAAYFVSKLLPILPEHTQTPTNPTAVADNNTTQTASAATPATPAEPAKPTLPNGMTIDENGNITLTNGSKVSSDGTYHELPPGAEWAEDGSAVTKIRKKAIGKDNLGYYALDDNGNKRYYDESTNAYTKLVGNNTNIPNEAEKPQLTTTVPGAIMTKNGLVTSAHKVPLYQDKRGQYFAKANGFAWYFDPVTGHYSRRDKDYERQIAGQRAVTGQGSGDLTASDLLRFGAIGSDVVGLAASMAPGPGSAVAGVTGLTSMGLDMAADINDPSVSAGEVVKNALVNTGLGVVGMLPGGKSASIVTKAVKFIPRVLTIYSAFNLAMDPATRNSLGKMAKAATDGDITQLNVNDWKNIGTAFQTALGVTSGVRAKINHERFKGAYEAPQRGKLVTNTNKFRIATKTADEKSTKIVLNKDQVDNIRQAGKSGGQEAAQKAFEAALPEEQKGKGLKLDSDYKTGIIKKHTSRDLSAEQVTENQGEHSYTREQALRRLYDLKYKSKWSDWQMYKRKRDLASGIDNSSVGQVLGHPIKFLRGKTQDLFNPHAALDKAREKIRQDRIAAAKAKTDAEVAATAETPVAIETRPTVEPETKPVTEPISETKPTTEPETEPATGPKTESKVEPLALPAPETKKHTIPKNFSMSRKQIVTVVNKKINEGVKKNEDYFGSDEGVALTNLKRLLYKSHRTEDENQNIRNYISKYKLEEELQKSESMLNSAKESAKEAKTAATTKKQYGGKLQFVLEMHRRGGLLIAKPGAKVTPITSTGVKFTNGTGADWRKQVFDQYRDKILSNLNTYGDDYANWLNNMQHNHSLLYNAANASGNWQDNAYANQAVKDYQIQYDKRTGADEINGFNQTGILNAENNNRYNISGRKRTSGDWGANGNKFKADGLYSAITDDRRLLGRKGVDWDENSQEFKDFKSQLANKGYDFYLDPSDNYYKLKKIGQPQDTTQQPQTNGNSGELGTYEPQEKPDIAGQILKGMTDPSLIGLGRLVGDIAGTNSRFKEYAQHLKPAMVQPYQVHRGVYGDYGTENWYANQGNKYLAQARKNVSSDANVNNAMQLEAQEKADQLYQKGLLADNEMIAKTKAASQQAAEFNAANNNEVANKNLVNMNENERELAELDATRKTANQRSVDDYLMELEKELKTKQVKNQHLQDQFDYLALGDPDYDFSSDPIMQNLQSSYNNAKTDEERTKIAKQAAEYHINTQNTHRQNYIAKLAELRGIKYKQPDWQPTYTGDVTSAKNGANTGIFLSEEVKTRSKDNDRLVNSILELIKEDNKTYRGLKQPKFLIPNNKQKLK